MSCLDMFYSLPKAVGKGLLTATIRKKSAKTIKEFPKIPFLSFLQEKNIFALNLKDFSFCSLSFVLLGAIPISIGLLPVGSKMVADINSINTTNDISDDSDANLFLSATDRSWSGPPEFLLMGDGSLLASSPTVNATPQTLGMWLSEGEPGRNGEISEYIVEKEDTIESIASRFDVSVNTIIWTNDLKNTSLKPGQRLLILPVSGVMHIVQPGDTVAKIAQRYKADSDKVFAFNYLSENEKLIEGEVLIVPDGQIVKVALSQPAPQKAVSILSTNNFDGQSHAYPFGQCTWWVAQKKSLPHPSLGNAKDWIKNAMAAGYQVCIGSSCVPKAGAVVSLSGNRVYGHVAYVEKVEDDKIMISEMNYIGWGKMNYRTIPIGSPQIKGYIY